MRQIIIVRHAKSSWKNSDLEDHDRPLSKRGERDAPYMAKILKDKKIQPDLLISSTAKRAVSTAKEFAEALGYKKHDIIREPKLYGADTGELLQFTNNLKEELNSVMIFGHNPGLTYFVNLLAQAEIDNLPTCGVVAIRFDIKFWNEVTAGKGSLEFFEYPRLYFQDLDD